VQNVIKKARLPERAFLVAPSETEIARFNPFTHCERLKLSPTSNKEMKMIGHHAVSTNGNVKLVPSSTDIGLECTMCAI
jgi:hypothetical protein